MKKLLLKLLVLFTIIAIPLSIVAYVDVFNVFHWDNYRVTAAEPNKNFIKTKYILANPQKFNAFLFGSSRIANLPPNYLPESSNGEKLYWYNMTHSEGVPAEHLQTLKTFIEHGLHINSVILGVDDISASVDPVIHHHQLLRMPYQLYEKDKFAYYRHYLSNTDGLFSIGSGLLKGQNHNQYFYDYGGSGNDLSLGTKSQPAKYKLPHPYQYKLTYEGGYKDIEELVSFCNEKNISLYVYTTPLYKATYDEAVKNGYHHFLKKLAAITPFYNFSGLNSYTVNDLYFYEWSHFKPALGGLIEQAIFNQNNDTATDSFGFLVDKDNVNEFIELLEATDNKYR